MFTAEEENDINLINKAIDASIKFEEKMESIDFNSYLLPTEEKKEITETSQYDSYSNQVSEIEEELEQFIKEANDEFISLLFEAKKTRLDARRQPDREDEKGKLTDAIYKLNKALGLINPEDFKKKLGRDIYDKHNWAKVLLYNEMAICYSGLIESSISLGYAERSILILKKLYPKIVSGDDEIDSRILLSYTFALYNKGEAERLLNESEQALKTFEEIFEIYRAYETKIGKKKSDYYSSAIRAAMILIDYGRGEEAIAYLKTVQIPDPNDYRLQDSDMEKAHAYIDMKEYAKAFAILENYAKEKWKFTFTQRKAKIDELRMVIEFIKNRYEDFNSPKDAFSETVKKKHEDFKKTAQEILIDCVERRDADNFKKTCIRLADYFHDLKEKAETPEDINEKWKSELRYYHLYLCYKIIFEEEQELEQEIGKKRIEAVSDWISEKEGLEDLIETYENKFNFSSHVEKMNDEQYLTGFFYTYTDLDSNKKDFCPSNRDQIILKLKEHLVDLFHEKDNLTEAAKIQEDYVIYEENKKRPKDRVTKKEDSVKFIRKYFLKEDSKTKENVCLSPESILKKMERNTEKFAASIVGKTKRFSENDEFKGTFTVLRRWNSFTPALTSSINPSKGGGYFLYFSYNNTTQGIVVDPGYDFLENLLSSGFRIGDINAVVVSHAHPDHTDSLPSILSLFHEANGRLGSYYNKTRYNTNARFNKKHLKLILSQGVFDQYYSGFIKPSQESLKDVIVVKLKTKQPCYEFQFKGDENYSISIEAFPTYHGDLMKWESLGFIVSINKDGTSIRKIGYTSDAHWTKEFSDHFKDCNTVCAHLGSIVDILGEKNFGSLCECYEKVKNSPNDGCKKYDQCKAENFKNRKPNIEKLLEQAHEQKHLYLSGLAMLFDDLLKFETMDLAIISEFGEELKGGIRMDLYNKFNDWFKTKSDNAKCIPGDIGLEINVMNNNILCSCCQEFKSKERILPIAYGKEEAIFFVCDECRSVLSSYQIGQRLNKYYENGRELELADESKK